MGRPAERDLGEVSADRWLAKMVLVLRPSRERLQNLKVMLEAQQTPGAREYHRWLTPEEFGLRYGLEARDIDKVRGWLLGQGFEVNEVAASGLLIDFSGTAGQVKEAFGTELHRYKSTAVERDGPQRMEVHLANDGDPRIPAVLESVITGVLSLDDFERRAAAMEMPVADKPGAGRAGSVDLTPAMLARIYDFGPMYRRGLRGAGASVAIVARSNVAPGDLARFEALYGLGMGADIQMPTGLLARPGQENETDYERAARDEATAALEWASVLAPEAEVKLIAAASTAATDGVDLAAEYAVNHRAADVLSVGFARCEREMSESELEFYNLLWMQASAEGMTVLVASGDGGAAGCGPDLESQAGAGAANGLCSSPYATCVGGTEIAPGLDGEQAMREEPTDGEQSRHLDERVWNDEEAGEGAGWVASGGGVSERYEQPAWQRGVIEDDEARGMRTEPDVAMPASGSASRRGGYLVYQGGELRRASGTSLSTTVFAAVLALIAGGKAENGLGHVNAQLYGLLHATNSPFHATVSGDNSVGGVAGYRAIGKAYNLATGVGSVDAAMLAEAWGVEGEERAKDAEADASIEASDAGKSGAGLIASDGRPEAAKHEVVNLAKFTPDASGRADATAAFQAAFDAATSVVQIPAGVYLIGCTNPLYLSRNNIRYVGAGVGKTVLRSCQGHTVPIAAWSCAPASGASCTDGKGPFTLTITTAAPVLAGVDTFYCAELGTTGRCTLETWHGEFPGFTTLDEQFTLAGSAFPSLLSTGLANPVFDCGPGCNQASGQTTFTIATTIAPTANQGNGGTFSLPQNMMQAYDARTGTRQTGSAFENLTFDGGCDQCKSDSLDTALVDMRNPQSAMRVETRNSFHRVAFSNYATTAVREDLTDGDSFTDVAFVNAGQTGINGDSPNRLTIRQVRAKNFGWQTDVRVVGTGTNYSSTFNFGCTTGGHSLRVEDVSVEPSLKSNFVGLGIWCGRATAQTESKSAYSGVILKDFTVHSAGNLILPVSAFADDMTIRGFRIRGYPDPTFASSPYMEIAGSNLDISGNENVGFYFAPIDEGSQVDGGTPVHTHYAHVSIHDNRIRCTTPTKVDTGCFGIAIGGFQNELGTVAASYIDGVSIYNNKAEYTFGRANQGNVVHVALGANEGGTGIPVGQLTNVHVYHESVAIAGSQARGGGWSSFATLWGKNSGNANWRFDHDSVRWTGSKLKPSLDHLRAMQGVFAANVTVEAESTPATPLLTNESGGSFSGITILPQ